ncbi:MAG: 50S ribosomal protein L11 [Pseudonocardia sp.]|nr:50S ribosomal protein L11 [Pseudonocardia sp.]
MPAKKPVHRVTLQLPAGAAPVVDLGKMLGQTGANLVEIKRRYDELSAPHRGDIVPAEITVFDDRSFTLRLRTPPTSFLIRRALDADGRLTEDALRAVALRKLPDLNTDDVGAAMRPVAGPARSMGVPVGFAG